MTRVCTAKVESTEYFRHMSWKSIAKLAEKPRREAAMLLLSRLLDHMRVLERAFKLRLAAQHAAGWR